MLTTGTRTTENTHIFTQIPANFALDMGDLLLGAQSTDEALPDPSDAETILNTNNEELL